MLKFDSLPLANMVHVPTQSHLGLQLTFGLHDSISENYAVPFVFMQDEC